MRRLVVLTSALCALITLEACESAGSWNTQNPQLVAEPDRVSLMLADAADRAALALESLSAIEAAQSPEIAIEPITNVPANLRRAVTVEWVGPAEILVKGLADRASYSFQTVGQSPAVPVVISVNVENKPIVEVLRSIGLQLGQRGDVKVDAIRQHVEIHYAPNTGAQGPQIRG